ncbi:carboxylating nicotinate-nucleotide diphosphorylase [Nitrospinae bacterium]|nr:carboxylating nicotinate-nucleotide diphosphorylase [Nitrospinota bacterium]
MTINLDSSAIDALVKKTLSEDIQNGDITTRNILHDEKNAVAEVIALEPMVLCGLEIFKAIFKELTTKVAFTSFEYNDGDEITAEETIIKIQCGAIPLLEGERSALNILQWLSGIATLTRKFVKKAAPVKVLDTRKTTPGLRIFEKYAVKCGGGTNHRFGLYDQVLIKDNHIEAAGSITNAMNHVRKNVNQDKKLEIEVKNLKEVKEAINNEADIIMLDNMSMETIKKSISLINGKSKIEISGGVTYDKLAEISKTGADYVSVGALTHSAPAVDISMKITSL